MNSRVVIWTSLVMAILCGFALASWGDGCADAPLLYLGQPMGSTGSDHVNCPGYSCTCTAAGTASTEDFEDNRSVIQKWNEADINCGCNGMPMTYQLTKTHTNTNKADVGATIGGSVSASVGANVAGLAKAEASSTATWEASLGLGTEAQDSETLTAAAQPTITKCHEGKYTKYYYEGVVQSVDTAHCAWSDQQGGSYNHCGYIDHSNAIIGTGKGLEPYTPSGSGFQETCVQCTKCNTDTSCYKGTACDYDPCD